MSKYHNDSSAASDPVNINLSVRKLRRLQPDLFGLRGWFFRFPFMGKKLGARSTRELFAEHMRSGDSRAAVVVQLSPLVVAAYTDELDCVALLGFPDWLEKEHSLLIGSRLLTVNTYGKGRRVSSDLQLGSQQQGNWTSFFPVIAEFVSDDDEVVERRKAAIQRAEWERAFAMGKAKLADPKRKVRDGRPAASWRPVT